MEKSIKAWMWNSTRWMLLGFSTIGSKSVEVVWSEGSRDVLVKDEDGRVVHTFDALLINRYYIHSDGRFTLWVNNTPHYFSVRYGDSRNKFITRLVNIFDYAVMEDLKNTTTAARSEIEGFKEFLDASHPGISGFAPLSAKSSLKVITFAVLMIATLAVVFVVFGVLSGFNPQP